MCPTCPRFLTSPHNAHTHTHIDNILTRLVSMLSRTSTDSRLKRGVWMSIFLHHLVSRRRRRCCCLVVGCCHPSSKNNCGARKPPTIIEQPKLEHDTDCEGTLCRDGIWERVEDAREERGTKVTSDCRHCERTLCARAAL